jgi:hypothetical protein
MMLQRTFSALILSWQKNEQTDVSDRLFLSSSERNEDKTVFPHPAAPLIHRIFDKGSLACQLRNLAWFKIQV